MEGGIFGKNYVTYARLCAVRGTLDAGVGDSSLGAYGTCLARIVKSRDRRPALRLNVFLEILCSRVAERGKLVTDINKHDSLCP